MGTEKTTFNLDISERDWHRFVFDNLPIGLITVDPNRRITYLNPYAEELTGWDEHEARGHFCGNVLCGSQCGKDCPLTTVLNRVRPSVIMRATLTNRQGETIPIHLRTSGLFSQSDELLGVVEAFYDISQTVALEEERERTLSFFAHDMKSPLISATGILNRLKAGKAGELDPKQRTYVEMAVSDLEHVQSLVTDYLDVVRLGTSQVSLCLERVDLGQSLLHLAESYRQRAEDKGLQWRLQLPDRTAAVEGDSIRLPRVFSNLLDNAVKFTVQGGVETVVEVGQGPFVRIRICDDGPGLNEEDMKSLFKPFFRGSASAKIEGTGLGLAAVKAIVEAHGGHIFVSNREGRGACFEVILPSAQEAE